MTTEIKLGRQSRDLTASIEIRAAADDQPTVLSFPLSSETPVERWYGTEILSHDPKAVRLERIKGGAAPLLFNHNWDDPIGMITGGRVQEGRLYVDATLFDTDRAREVAKMIEGGLRNVSIGYEVNVFEEDTKKSRYTAVDWMPLEGSIVTVPADISVGLGRAAEEGARPVTVRAAAAQEPQPAQATPPQGVIMSLENNAAPGVNGEPTGGEAGERLRIKALQNLARQHKVDEKTVDGWVDGGISVDDACRQVLDIIAERGKTNPQSPAHLGLTKKEVGEYSIFRALNAVREKNWSKAGFELEAHRAISGKLGRTVADTNFFIPLDVQMRAFDAREVAEIQRRDLTVATASAGGYLVATENMSFIELLRNRSVCMSMGARRLTGLQGNITIPKQTGAATAVWLANEASTATESGLTFGQLAFTPKTVSGYVEVSRLLSIQSSPAAEALVMDDLAKVVGLAGDSAGLAGTGASGQPTGVTNTAGIGAVAGASLAYAGIIEFQTDVASSNVMPSRGGFVTTPIVAGLLMARQRFASTDTPLWDGNVWNGTVSGFPGMSSNQMAAGTMLFGDWSELVFAEWGVLEIEVNPYANFQAGISGVRAMYTMDVGVRYPGAFSLASSIT